MSSSLFALAEDIVRLRAPQSHKDYRENYQMALLEQVMQKTIADFGPYKIEIVPAISRERVFVELVNNRLINVTEAPLDERLMANTRTIYFPTRKGYYSYRVLLIDKHKAPLFEKVESLDQLKQLRAGLHTHWSTTRVFKSNNLNVVETNSYEGMFGMLAYNRFDYFPRTLNEAQTEVEVRQADYPNMIIEGTIVLHVPYISYYYVAPQEETLAVRIEAGLHIMHEDGSFDELFNAYHDVSSLKELLTTRKVFYIDNPLISHDNSPHNKDLWIYPDTPPTVAPNDKVPSQ